MKYEILKDIKKLLDNTDTVKESKLFTNIEYDKVIGLELTSGDKYVLVMEEL